MRLFILAFCFFILTVTNSFSHLNFAIDSFRDTIIETETKHLNGNVQMKTFSFIDKDGITYKVVKEFYRKDGSKKSVFVMDQGITILYKAQYDKFSILIYEKFYRYNFKNNLVQIETKRDGISKFKTFDTDIYGDSVE